MSPGVRSIMGRTDSVFSGQPLSTVTRFTAEHSTQVPVHPTGHTLNHLCYWRQASLALLRPRVHTPCAANRHPLDTNLRTVSPPPPTPTFPAETREHHTGPTPRTWKFTFPASPVSKPADDCTLQQNTNDLSRGQQKSPKCSTWKEPQKQQNDLCSFPRQTIQYHSNPSLCPNH